MEGVQRMSSTGFTHTWREKYLHHDKNELAQDAPAEVSDDRSEEIPAEEVSDLPFDGDTQPFDRVPDDEPTDALDRIDDNGRAVDSAEPLMDDDALADLQAFKSLEERRKKEKHRKKVRIIVICVIAAVLIAGCVVANIVAKMASSASTAAATATVDSGEFVDTVTGSATLDPVSSTNVTPEVDGIIDTVYVSVGGTVNAGDVLFTLKNDSLDQAVTQADEQVKTAQNGVDAAKVSLDNAYSALSSYQNTYNESVDAYNASLSSTAGAAAAATTKPSYDDSTYTGAISSGQVALDGAYISLETAQSAYNDAVAKAAKRTVTAPCSGSIVSMNAVSGTAVSSGASTGLSSSSASAAAAPLIQIADSSQMTVTIQVNEVDITKVAVGQAARVTFPAVSGLTLDGTVQSIATVSTASTTTTASGSSGVVTYAVKLLIPNPDPRLKPGMTANVTITTATFDDVLMVPVAAVQTADDGSRYLIKVNTDDQGNTSTENQTVTVKTQSSTTAVVEGDGLEAGETIQISSTDASATSSTTTG